MKQQYNFQITVITLSLIMMFSSCKDDDGLTEGSITDSRDGRTYSWIRLAENDWMTEDLQLNGQESYHYFEALDACPEGWRLPTLEEWQQLTLSEGGYEFYSEEFGDQEVGYTNLTDPSRFNSQVENRYWTASPSWLDASSIRSDVVVLSETSYHDHPTVYFAPNLQGSDMSCRCIRGEKLKEGFLRFETNRGTFEFADYINSDLADSTLRLYAYNLNSDNEEDWISVFMDPRGVTVGDQSASITYEFVQEIMRFDNDRNLYYNREVTLSISEFNEERVQGIFSGVLINGLDTLNISEGSFLFEL